MNCNGFLAVNCEGAIDGRHCNLMICEEDPYVPYVCPNTCKWCPHAGKNYMSCVLGKLALIHMHQASCQISMYNAHRLITDDTFRLHWISV
ncbi:hypothetical protein DPMN_043114 [Dreissena polymorpha]|uniref:Uncharacterized protein n=1 Tax=Dreissena polymorpha TaxID=45954 RepID=A0A9D4CZV8_DREPO|nr:hypothetical protein DPMN_043114 [Dreissena polymorpha]